MNKIDATASSINKKGYSPLEKLIYVYDLVRQKEYKLENEGEDAGISRDLSSVLFGDRIVCAGYANICNIFLNKLGIKSEVYHLIPKKGNHGHDRNVIFLKDKKYGIDGIYFLDATFDSKKNKNNKYLYSYRYFCKPFKFFSNNNKDYESEYDWVLDDIKEDIYNYLDFGIGAVNVSSLHEINSLIKKINKLSTFVDGKKVMGFPQANISKKSFIKKMNKYKKLFNNPISAENFLKAVETVRKDQYLDEPDKYPYGLKAFYNILLNSEFNFEGYLTESEKIYKLIFKENLKYEDDEKEKNFSRKILDLSKDTDFGRESEQIRLVKVLNELKNKKIK